MSAKTSPKMRLDQLLVHRELVVSRSLAQALIMAGKVLVNGRPARKAGEMVAGEAEVRIQEDSCPFVSRAGQKLDGFLSEFPFSIEGAICADLGASTGGFTDCLLQRGAARVFALDVGYGQLDFGLRKDPRVEVLEKHNARHLDNEAFGCKIDLFTVDVSFISIRKIIPQLIEAGGGAPLDLIALIKPQFEAGKAEADRGGGIIKDLQVHCRILREIREHLSDHGWTPLALSRSCIKGAAGNQEYLIGATTKADFRSNSFKPDWDFSRWLEYIGLAENDLS